MEKQHSCAPGGDSQSAQPAQPEQSRTDRDFRTGLNLYSQAFLNNFKVENICTNGY